MALDHMGRLGDYRSARQRMRDVEKAVSSVFERAVQNTSSVRARQTLEELEPVIQESIKEALRVSNVAFQEYYRVRGM